MGIVSVVLAITSIVLFLLGSAVFIGADRLDTRFGRHSGWRGLSNVGGLVALIGLGLLSVAIAPLFGWVGALVLCAVPPIVLVHFVLHVLR